MNCSEFLENIQAVDKGKYYVCICPECKKKEGFLFKDDLQKALVNPKHKVAIHCNRKSECGMTTQIQLSTSESAQTSIPTPSDDEILHMNQIGVKKIEMLVDYLSSTMDYSSFPSWRGISASTLQKYEILLYPQTMRKFLSSFPNSYDLDFFDRSLYEKNLLIPVKDFDGSILRLLLRTTDPEKEKEYGFRQEVNLPLVINRGELWNRKDIRSNSPFLFVTEGVPDALSIKEIDPSLGVVALPGVAKYRQLLDLIKNEKNFTKQIILCFDSDKAGFKFKEKFKEESRKMNLNCIPFPLQGFKDINEFLLKDKKNLERLIHILQHGHA